MQGNAASGGRRKQAGDGEAALRRRAGRIVLIRNGKLVAPALRPIKKPR